MQRKSLFLSYGNNQAFFEMNYRIIFLCIAALLLDQAINFSVNLVSSRYNSEEMPDWGVFLLIAFIFLLVLIAAFVYFERTKQQTKIDEGETRFSSRKKKPQQVDRKILLKQVKHEVLQRLANSLHNEVLIQLGKQFDPTQVADAPWQKEVVIRTQTTNCTYTTSDPIANIFADPEIDGYLLLLGNPGSGKTTTLVKLAETLVERALTDDTAPMPVLLNLSSWQPQQSLVDWMVSDLNLKYGVSRTTAQRWLQKRALLPLLDGLDEVAPKHQDTCAQAINTYLSGEQRPQSAVVCSRAEEYRRFETQLTLNASLRILPLSRSKIQHYLQEVGQMELWEGIRNSQELYDLVRVPLFLSMTVLAAKRLSLQQWRQCETDEERRRFLFAAYLAEALQSDEISRCNYSQKWLEWLAQRLKNLNLQEFYIEALQPTWLDETLFWKYKIVYGLFLGLVAGLNIGLVFGLVLLLNFRSISEATFGLAFGLSFGLIFGIIYALIGRPSEIRIENSLWLGTMYQAKRECEVLILGVIFAMIYELIFGQTYGLILLLMFTLIYGLKINYMHNNRNQPNQGMWYSFHVLCLMTYLGYPVGFLILTLSNFALISTVGKKLPETLVLDALISGIALLTLLGSNGRGALDCIQHGALRFVLWRQGVAPWNYARFLQYMVERRVMQQVGGGFRFIHDLLRKHLAEGEF